MKQEQDDRLEVRGNLGSPREFSFEKLQPPEIVGQAERKRYVAAARHRKPVPDAAAVAAARARRDHGWSLIRCNKVEGEPLRAEIAAYGDAVCLAAAFERAIGDADDLADRRDAESVRLATIAGLEDAVANLRIGIE
jgi:hypothetical protein